MIKAIVSTSANPFHYGHLDIYNKAESIFGNGNVKVIIALNSDKNVNLSAIKFHMNAYQINYEIIQNKTVSDYCYENDVNFIVRGIRNGVDAEYELKLDFANREINPNVQTIFIPTNDTFSNLSSSTIREFIKYGKYDIIKKYMNEDALYRYLEGSPKYTCYFGKSCVGKSTWIEKNIKNSVCNVDKFLWEILEKVKGKNNTDYIKNASKTWFKNGEFSTIQDESRHVWDKKYWDVFLKTVIIF